MLAFEKEVLGVYISGHPLEEYEDISLYAYTEKKELEQALASKHFDALLFDPSIYDGRSLGKSTLFAETAKIFMNDIFVAVENNFIHRCHLSQRRSIFY